ncbi:response regulator transcription factor [Rhodococcus sp. IEGM 1381]|uniref:response regulator n=1 Tax=Rhodococcus sp. IEGM 1381 TaxID=3047085 RepID=UPI0024B81E3F|nr:response regulator transcription factor [Rhodococcus sp. IEGM 1381]MDI9896470.1 response regulator transcription factor [Rhodococcus sp. IEGM 1381]
MIRVGVVDDDPMVRLGVGELLSVEPGITVVREGSTGREAVAIADAVDVLLVDIRMPESDGIDAARAVRTKADRPRIVVMTVFGSDKNIYRALSAGADGFLLKSSIPALLVGAIETVFNGGVVLDPGATRSVIQHFRMDRGPSSMDLEELGKPLTPREIDVLACVSRGLSNSEIALELGMRENTVKVHVSRILAALHQRNRVQLALYARDVGLGR